MKKYKPNEIISLLLDKSKKNGASDAEVIISKSFGKSKGWRFIKKPYYLLEFYVQH